MDLLDRIATKEARKRIKGKGSISAHVHAIVLEQIQRGDILPGEKLVDLGLAQRLDVSRMPVREALVRLVNEGYLIGTSRGFTLAQLDPREISDIFEVRRLLEPHAAALVARHIDDAGIAALEAGFALYEQAKPAGDLDDMRRGLTDFRLGWISHIPNGRLAATISRFADHCQIVRTAALHDAATQTAVTELIGDLLCGFQRRDPQAAHAAISRLLDRSEDHLAWLASLAD